MQKVKDASESLLSAKSICKEYGQLPVLENINLHIQSGEFVAITGKSGAGKSTLLHILGGLDKPTQGSVKILGKDLFALSGKKLTRFRNEHIGFVFQFHHLLPEFTALENVCLPLWIRGAAKNEAEDRARKVLERVDLSDRVEHKPGALSGGEQQRVAIARALVTRPAVIFADEPTGNLDSENAAAIHQLFLGVQREFHLTFIVVTHNKDLAAMAERELKMKDGAFV